MSAEYQDYCNANYDPEDEPTREEQEADAWEYWHQRAIKLDRENHKLRALVQTLIDNDPDEPIADNGMTVLDGWREQARRALSQWRETQNGQ